ncbi:MAG: VOC family protein, partial [Cytophagales bacterium]
TSQMKQLFINLPVKDVEASMEFYEQLGFIINPLFTFDHQKCMVWGDQIYLMLQTYEMFESGCKKSIPDTQQNVIVTFTLTVESIESVNKIVENGLKAGGTEPTPMRDEGFMQVRNIEDIDGHNWGIAYLNIEKFREITGRK